MSRTIIYALRDIRHAYGKHEALRLETFEVAEKTILGLVGPNGSGKSTLLKLLAFVEAPTEGTVLFMGKPCGPFSEAARFKVSLLTQTPCLMKRSVFDNVAYGLKVRGDHKRLKTRVYDALFLVGLAPDQFAGRMWRALSGGEAQRVSLAARLVLEPKVLLLDEPTASVDATSEQIIKEVALSARKQRGTTLVIASHDRQWLYEICDETVHLFNGKWFGSGMETLVFGPWKPLQDGRWAKVLNGSRMLVVPEPPHPDAVAVFHPDCLTLTPTADTGGADRHTLAGEITRCSLWRAHHRIAATVVVDNLGFTVLLTGEDIARHGIMPGQPVYLHYDAAGIQWHTFQGQ